jgi:hypothetical protein
MQVGTLSKRSIALAGICTILLFSNGVRADQSLGPRGQQGLPSEAADAERVADLMKNGVRLGADRITAWFAPEAMPPEDMKLLLDRMDRGLKALEAFLHAPRAWQSPRRDRVEYFFVSGPFFVPHVNLKGQVMIPLVRLRDGQAPILHETTHALLPLPQGRRPLAWLTEGVAEYVAKAVSADTGIREGDTFDNGEVHELDARCAAGLASAQGPRIVPFIGAPGNLSVLYAMEPAFLVRQTFYGCAASFTKFLVDKLGIERVVDLLPEADPHKKLEGLAGMKMAALRSSWAAKIGAKVPR